MARPLSMDTLQQEFWKEQYLQELRLRFRWRQRFGASVKAKQEQRRRAAREPLKLPALRSPAPVAQAQRPPQAPAGAAPGIPEGEMKPVAPEVRKLLYQGISQDGEGRAAVPAAPHDLRARGEVLHPRHHQLPLRLADGESQRLRAPVAQVPHRELLPQEWGLLAAGPTRCGLV
ncbi:unnamed protein product, partial [Lepidochelys kempii]